MTLCAAGCDFGVRWLDTALESPFGKALRQPEGLRDNSRWSETTGKRSVAPRTLKGCKMLGINAPTSVAPLQGASRLTCLTEVYAALRPPATIWQPCGL